MLQPEEFRDRKLSINPPAAEHFEKDFEGRPRVIDIRAACRETDGKRVSVVTDICKPRDAVWQCIEGVYEGGQPGTRNGRPFWLQEDGTAIRYTGEEADRRRAKGELPDGVMEWLMWSETTNGQLYQWFNDDGSFQQLTEEQMAALDGRDPYRYQIARRRLALGLLRPSERQLSALEEDLLDSIGGNVEYL